MIHEVYSGSKPGRPRLLLALCAALLAGTLGIAWIQTHDARRVGGEVRIPGTPLVLRPPADWASSPNYPGLFVQAPRGGPRHQVGPDDRPRIEIRYDRQPAMQPLGPLLAYRTARNTLGIEIRDPIRIGEFFGVEALRARPLRSRRVDEGSLTLYRLAVSPRGDEIRVEYFPLLDLSWGDEDLLNAVCASIRLGDAPAHHIDQAAAQRAGLEFPLAENWRLFGPTFDEIPGLYVQTLERGQPVWALGLFRTWLGAGRRPADLLGELAYVEWRAPAELVRIGTHREGGLEISEAHHPNMPGAGGVVASARVVTGSAGEVVLLYVFSDDAHKHVADQAAADLIRALKFQTNDLPQGLDVARSAGEALARRLIEEGRSPARRADAGQTQAFVPPNLETQAAAWVSRQTGGAWLIEVNSPSGGDTHWRLLRPLAPASNGNSRVLVVDDYRPQGFAAVFDEDGRIVALENPPPNSKR